MKTSILVAGHSIEAPEGVHVEQSTWRFAAKPRTGPVYEVLAHESTTKTGEGCIQTLDSKGYGVHLLIHEDAHVTQHADLAFDRLVHAAGHNGPSVGIEFVNPYYKLCPPWTTQIRAAWADKERYVVPTPEQLEVGAQLLGWLTSDAVRPHLQIPRNWVGFRDGLKFAMSVQSKAQQREPGIHAHHYSAHADAAFPVLYALLRLEWKLSPKDAYAQSCVLAATTKDSVDLSGVKGGGAL